MRAIIISFGIFLLVFASIGYFTEAQAKDVHAPLSHFYTHYLNKIDKTAKLKIERICIREIPKMKIMQKRIVIEEHNTSNSDENNCSRIYQNKSYDYNWTFMIYLDGDSDLAPYATIKLNELLNIRERGVAIVVLYDGNNKNDSCLYIIAENVSKINVGEKDMGSKQTLEEFISFSKENYSAKHYFLEIWGHGNGWKGVCFDKTNRDYLSMQELKNAISDIDVLSISACYMGSVEVAYELRGKASYFLAPEGSMLATGLPYTAIFNNFNASMNEKELVELIMNEYASYYSHTTTNFAAWNMSMVCNLSQAITGFVKSVDISLANRARNGSAIDGNFVDLYNFVRFFHGHNASILMQAINKTIIAKYGSLHGVEIYLPLPNYYSSIYSCLDFSATTTWDKFIRKIVF